MVTEARTSNKGEKSQIPSSLDFTGFAHKMACSESSCTECTSSSHREQPLQPEKGIWVHNFSMRSQPKFMLSLFQIVALVDISEYSITNSSGGGNCPQPNPLPQDHTSHYLLYHKHTEALENWMKHLLQENVQTHRFINLCSSESVLGTPYPKLVHIPLLGGRIWTGASKGVSNLQRPSAVSVST